MGYSSLRECALDLEHHRHLIRVQEEVDPFLQMAEIQRRLYAHGGPAILFENVKGCRFPALCNLFGTVERARFIFRDTLRHVTRIVEAKADPSVALRAPWRFARAPLTALASLPRRLGNGPILENQTTIDQLPPIQSWPDDGGPFVTLPQVYTEDFDRLGARNANVGMYRIQLAGNEYVPNKEIGLHYQIHRGIGVHHTKAVERGERLRVSIFVGGPPAHTFAAVMPMPEGLSELLFSGMLAGRRFRYVQRDGFTLSADADFCITGTVDANKLKPEGPFGDHLGYYSLSHDFPVLDVHAVYHRNDAIWPFTVVGRPPQEDTTFGQLIHEITGPMVPKEISGLRALHAVDAAGVHPLLLAIGSERYVPYGERSPQEILTIANAILGFNQCSLAKYLVIVAGEDNPALHVHDIERFWVHTLQRVDWRRDLHFQTRTTMDTLDYSGTGLNQGSKVVIAAAGEPRRDLDRELPASWLAPAGFGGGRLALPGVLVLGAPSYETRETGLQHVDTLVSYLETHPLPAGIPMVVLTDDPEFAAGNLHNWLWVTFTRSNPSHDMHGVGAFFTDKHWGCESPLIIDARTKPHHAPPLIEDAAVSRRVDELAAPGGPFHGIF